MLVSEVIDRTYNEWLYPAGVDRPTYDVLAQDVDTAVDTIVVEGRVKNIPGDTILEIESEALLVQAVSGTSVDINERGYLNTDPASHDAGVRVLIDPKYPRKTIFNTITSVIAGLYPAGLYVRSQDDTQAFQTDANIVLATGAKKVLGVLVDRGSAGMIKLFKGRDYRDYPEFSPVQIRCIRGGVNGDDLTIFVAKDFILPTSEDDDLTTLGVPETLQPYIPMSVAGYLLQGQEIPRIVVEQIKRLLSAQGANVAAGTTMNIGRSMQQYFDQVYVGRERSRLAEQDPLTFEFVTS